MATQMAQRPVRFLSSLLLTLILALTPIALAQQSPGNAVQLSGTDYIRTTLWSHQLFNSESFSFEMWFNPTSPGVLIGEPDTANVNLWDIAFAELLADGSIVVGVPGAPTFSAGTVSLNSWTHLVVTYNHLSSTLAAYINGAPAGSSVGPRNSPADISRTAVYCFGRGGPRNLGPGGFLRGRIDEVRIWRVPLTAQDVAASWNRIRTTDGEGLMANWHFDARVENNPALSPDSRTAGDNPAWYVPDTQTMPLVPSTAPLEGAAAVVVTQNATVSGGAVTLRGLANPRGSDMSVGFDWGLTTSYGNTTPLLAIGNGTSDVSFAEVLNQLPPGTYHFRAIGVSGGVTVRGADQTFTVAAPTVSTEAPTVTGRNVALRGLANPQGYPMTVHFEWGPTISYGNQTTAQEIGNGTAQVSFTAELLNLQPGTYHVRAVGTTSAGIVRGSDRIFTILAPTVSTTGATVTDRSAQLRGSANPQGFSSSVHFQWGPTTQYGSATPAQEIGSGITTVNFTETLTGLAAGTYHYRAVLISGDRTVFGSDASFTISPPSVQTLAPILPPNGAELRGIVNPRGFPLTAFFEWGTTDFGNTTTPQEAQGTEQSVTLASALANLAPGNYQYRAVIRVGDQTIRGETVQFVVGGIAGKAVRLSGNDYIRTTTWSNDIFDDEDFTFELWFNASGPGVLINEADTSDPTRWDYAFAEILPGGVLKAGAPGVPTFTVGTVPFNAWRHLTLVYDGAANVMSAYLNGQPAGTSSGDRETPREIGRTSVYTFGRGGMANLGLGNWYSGLLDEIRISRRVISAAEVSQRFNVILRLPEEGLMGNWHFDEVGSPTYTSPDDSGRNNPAWYVPQNVTIPLQPSTAPVIQDQRPIASSVFAATVSPGVVRLSGTINPNGLETSYYFELIHDGVVQRTPNRTIPAGNSPVTVSEVVSGLALNTPYQFRLAAGNSAGSSMSALASFTSTGWAGGALHFNNTLFDYIRTANIVPVSAFPTRSITLEFWFRPTKAGVLAADGLTATGSASRSIIEVLASGAVEAGFQGLVPLSLGTAAMNEWNHVALRYDEGTQTMHGFLNGVRSAPRTGAREAAAGLFYSFGRATNVRIGSGEFYGGDLDEIRIWNTARTDDEIVGFKNFLVGAEPNLVLYWRLDNVAGSSIPDNGPNGVTGTNLGADPILSSAPLSFGLRVVAQNQIEGQFLGQPGTIGLLQVSSDLQTWSTVQEITVPSSGVVRAPITVGNEVTRVYRFIARPAP